MLPDAGDADAMVAGAENVNAPDIVAVPPALVNEISTNPAARAGVVATRLVALLDTIVPVVVPKRITVTSARFSPTIEID